jgi:hypothetical protein
MSPGKYKVKVNLELQQQQGHEADHSPPESAKVNKMWIYTSTPLYACMA